MTKNNCSAKALALQKPAPVPARSKRQDHNHPVAIDAFDREHMGIAAKE